ncbi:LOW QUALITY PROTEIN: NADH-ubiquinone oxidoreductase chain 1-like [Musca domestica]|uniref:NADH-ubiquinone oxidoreductase chain 1 n=1 Tax=Musca domestica TaxID=7370 RepID=A0ABM3V3H4_MUSDO|nr:LOW QUALITY PROTEIN: NADH-ubiquinone oxidoreductase chain 1-like [Musca domestica]
MLWIGLGCEEMKEKTSAAASSTEDIYKIIRSNNINIQHNNRESCSEIITQSAHKQQTQTQQQHQRKQPTSPRQHMEHQSVQKSPPFKCTSQQDFPSTSSALQRRKFIIGSLLLVICVLVRAAFLTLLERKVLGYIQIRKGPNKVGIIGIPQPFCDAIKLFTKEQTYPLLSNYISYYFSPIFSLFLSLLVEYVYLYLLTERNRTPFDFAEGESELVSGFNIEYRIGGFALIFLAEYASTLCIRMLLCVIFLGT